jgi:flavin-dependent dehydrogenase
MEMTVRRSIFEHSHYDAVIVGARCAGAATAFLLARQGWRVLLIDRAPYGSDTLSTHALMRVGVQQLERFGLRERLAELGAPAIRRTVFHYGGDARMAPGTDPNAIELMIKPRHGVDALYAPRRTTLDRLLVDAACDAGVEVQHSCGLLALQPDWSGRVAGAVLAPEGLPPHTVSASWVIGADGRRSTVARMLDVPLTRTGRAATATVFGYYAGLDVDDPMPSYHWLYAPQMGTGIIPTDEGHACVFAGTHPDRLQRAIASSDAERALQQLVAESSPELAAALARAQRVEKPRVFMGAPGFSRKPAGPGWALVGDAGAFRDPLTAHGISDALRDAELLARALLSDSQAGIAAYEQQRDALNEPLFDVTERIASFEWSLAELPLLHRELNRAMSAQSDAIAALDPLPIDRVSRSDAA